MLRYIKGQLVKKLSGKIIIESNNMGIEIYFPESALGELGAIGEEVKVFTELYVKARENDGKLELYGFITERDLALFKILVNVNKVGPKLALGIISELGANKVIIAITSSDWKTLSTVSGVGKKTAQKLVIELKEKLSKEFGLKAEEMNFDEEVEISDDLYLALKALGFSQFEINKAISKCSIDIQGKDIDFQIKKVLEFLR